MTDPGHGGGEAPTPVTDPVCGMKIDPAKAAGSVEHQGKAVYFCGKSCLAKFVADPDRYLSPAEPATTKPVPSSPASPASASGAYVCPMDPDVRSALPGACPKCGMALERAAIAPPASKTEYVCPMHPEIIRSEPGNCPICGMALEPRVVSMDEPEDPESIDMRRRFGVGVVLTIPVFLMAMSDLIPGNPLPSILARRTQAWLEMVLSTPVVLLHAVIARA